jgi:hypothetical protein
LVTLAVSIALDRMNSDSKTPRNCAFWASMRRACGRRRMATRAVRCRDSDRRRGSAWLRDRALFMAVRLSGERRPTAWRADPGLAAGFQGPGSPGYGPAIGAPLAVVASGLVTLAWLRHRFFRTSFARSFLAITVGGAIIAALSAAWGSSPGAEEAHVTRQTDLRATSSCCRAWRDAVSMRKPGRAGGPQMRRVVNAG